MKSITVHKIEDQLMTLIQQKAREKGLSLNKTIKLLLREALGLNPVPDSDRKKVFVEFSGLWTEEEAAAFKAKTRDFDKIDPADWA